MLGKNYVRATYRWLVTSSQAYCLVADTSHEIIGMVTVCDGPFTRPMFLACLPEFIRSLLRSPKLFFEKNLWNRLLRRPEASNDQKRITDYLGFAQLMVVAVDADYRGAGIFSALAEAATTCSKNRGSVAIRAGSTNSINPAEEPSPKMVGSRCHNSKQAIQFSTSIILTLNFQTD